MRLLFLLLLVLSTTCVSADFSGSVKVLTETLGPFQQVIVWSDGDSVTNPTMHLGTAEPVLVSGGVVSVVGEFTMVRPTLVKSPLVQPVPAASGAVVLQVDSNLIILGPRGCDAPDGDPNNAFITNNCVSTQAQAYTNYQNILKNFAYPFYGENRFLCTSGDFFSCLANFGGLLFIYPNQDPLVVRQAPPPAQVFFVQRVILVGVAGLQGTERTTVDVNIQGPLLAVTSQQGCGAQWQDTYSRFPYDVYTGMGSDVVQSARGSINTLARVLVRIRYQLAMDIPRRRRRTVRPTASVWEIK